MRRSIGARLLRKDRVSGMIPRRIHRRQQFSRRCSQIAECSFGTPGASIILQFLISAMRVARMHWASRRLWRLSAEPAKIEELAWHYSGTICNSQSAPYRRPDPTACGRCSGKSKSCELSATPMLRPCRVLKVPRDAHSAEDSRLTSEAPRTATRELPPCPRGDLFSQTRR